MLKVIKQSKNSFARTGELETAHGKIQTPVFMPCATVGAVKGISSEELQELGFKIILGNTYHLYLRPGDKEIKKIGYLHKFMNWPHSILTDSGGYQIFSLGKDKSEIRNPKSETNSKFKIYKFQTKDYDEESFSNLVKINKNSVTFRSHLDGSRHQFTPEKVIDIQKNIGSDIVMVLDVCTEYPATHERAKKTMESTHQWAKRSIEYWLKHKNSKQHLFGIIQGSTYKDLRGDSAKFISSLPFDGIAVGGVSVGEGKKKMYEVMKWVGPLLPKDKPHYLMGVGEPEDIIFAVKYGFDMFDCVLPTRLGRHGTVWTTANWPLDFARGKQNFQKIDLRKSAYRMDKKVIMKDCACPACADGYSRAYISHLIRAHEMLGLRLASLHNLWILAELMQKIRATIDE